MAQAVHGHGLAAGRERHPAALPWTRRLEIHAQVVGSQAVEQGVDAGAVVALRVVLGDDLPIRGDVVFEARCSTQGREVAPELPRVMVVPVAHRLREGARIRIKVDEHEATPGLEANGRKAEFGRREVLDVLHVPGSDEGSLEVIDPRVVGALEADQPAGIALDDGGTAVAAHVVEGPEPIIRPADRDERLADQIEREIGARIRSILLAADTDPLAEEPFLSLEREDGRVVVRPGGQERRAAKGPPDRGELLRGQR